LADHSFEHLPLVLRRTGPARFTGGGEADPLTAANRANRQDHAQNLATSAGEWSTNWVAQQNTRTEANLPAIPAGIPLLLKVDPNLDIDELRKRFEFEVVSEEEDGFVIVASADISLQTFQEVIGNFAGEVRGSATVSSIHGIDTDPNQKERLTRLLSEKLMAEWAEIDDGADYVIDFGISCVGDWQIPKKPSRGRRTDETWAKVESQWSHERAEAYIKWDELRERRVEEAENILIEYNAEVLGNYDGGNIDAPALPDSFTLRVKLSGLALRDFVLNYPYLFEVVEPDDIETPQHVRREEREDLEAADLRAPSEDAPAVCVIDSGIQENHLWLEPAIDQTTSTCFLKGKLPTDVADEVLPDGHGTRVAGALLHGEHDSAADLEVWVQNARVLDEQCHLPQDMLPASVMRDVITRFHEGPRRTRIFNHSINADAPCRTKHMSSWAAEIDQLSNEYDILVIQSAGNIRDTATPPKFGLLNLLESGQAFPDYFSSPSCRIANPAQSLQALTVGSVGYRLYEDEDWQSFATAAGDSSGFSRAGLGIWETIKPEVVEFGGDYLLSKGSPRTIGTPGVAESCYARLTRATLAGGPAIARDGVGTSFAAPKVAKIAARLAKVLPDESTLAYRGLIAQSARWPDWAESLSREQQSALLRRIGFGVPDIDRASTNSDFRTTFLSGTRSICSGECHVFQVPIPNAVRTPGDEFDVRIDVTLSYAATPRRTRRTQRGYLATWTDWITNRIGERQTTFLTRALRGGDEVFNEGQSFGWTIENRSDWGRIPTVRRNVGTLQKDWALLKSNVLPEDFCIAVRGHRGWSLDPDSSATYALTVTFEVLGQELRIYEPLRDAVIELQNEIELEAIEIEVDET
jgi:hypothetical protein